MSEGAGLMVHVVHLIKHGRALCGKGGLPEDWPRGHCWVSFEDIDNAHRVNCPRCMAVLRGDPMPEVVPGVWAPVEYLPPYETRVLVRVQYPSELGICIGSVVRARRDFGPDNRHPSGPLADVWLNDDGVRLQRPIRVTHWMALPSPQLEVS